VAGVNPTNPKLENPPPPRAETIAQPRPAQVEPDRTQVQPRDLKPDRNDNKPDISVALVKPIQKQTPWLKIAVASLIGFGSIGGIYLFSQSRSNPSAQNPVVSLADVTKLVDNKNLPEAIELANKITQNSPDYAKAQSVSADAAKMVTADKLYNGGKIKDAIALLETIPASSPISDPVKKTIVIYKSF
jgi:hypothetical protein